MFAATLLGVKCAVCDSVTAAVKKRGLHFYCNDCNVFYLKESKERNYIICLNEYKCPIDTKCNYCRYSRCLKVIGAKCCYLCGAVDELNEYQACSTCCKSLEQLTNDKCHVCKCHYKLSNYYGAKYLVCLHCKNFFSDSYLDKSCQKFSCINKSCQLDENHINQCKSCRFKKCLVAEMNHKKVKKAARVKPRTQMKKCSDKDVIIIGD